jgi:predicted metal-dependent enzyme (double-stranded beta helix superfamily)
MAYTLEALATDIRGTLKSGPISTTGPKVVAFVEKALKDKEFVQANLGKPGMKTREIIYEDPETGFCVCAHTYEGAAASPAHDHGPSWAIYGQAIGVTEMTDWKIVKKGEGEQPSIVEPVRVYKLEPGMAKFYDVGAVHSPKRDSATKLIRVEGKNLDTVKRSNIKAA